MGVAIVTGGGGLVGATTVRYLSARGLEVVGIDNNMRRQFFGEEASVAAVTRELEQEVGEYHHLNVDIRDQSMIESVFAKYGKDIEIIVHAAGQPSHDWAATAPDIDFAVNATGTLTLLEATRKFSPAASFVFTSTNKVYGDAPNRLPLVEKELRWEVCESDTMFEHGISENMSIDQTRHSLFGASKAAADLMVQEYGRYFGINTVCFRCGCITGPAHRGTRLHGFLSYLVRCAVTRSPYTIIGYGGKQVRDNLHASDLVSAFWQYHQSPQPGRVYNMGGGRRSHCSVLEAISLVEDISGSSLAKSYDKQARLGDHIWYVSDLRKFKSDYPGWTEQYGLEEIVQEIVSAHVAKAPPGSAC